MRHLVSLSIVISLVTFLFVAPGCQQKPKEEVKPAEVTEPAKEMGKEVMEEGKEAVEAGKEMVEEGKEAAKEMMEEGKEMMEKPEGEMMEKPPAEK